jgi:hypothetical protein
MAAGRRFARHGWLLDDSMPVWSERWLRGSTLKVVLIMLTLNKIG